MNGSRNQYQPGYDPLPSASTFVHFHPFAQGGVLFREGTRRIWTLNSTSAFIWCMLESVSDLEELAETLVRRYDIGADTALHDASEAVACFAREGLLAGGTPQTGASETEEDPWDITPCGPRLAEPPRWALRSFFATPRQVFRFCCADFSLGESFIENLTHLMVGDEVSADTELAVLRGRGRTESWDVYLDGRQYVGGVARHEVLPYLTTLVFVRACQALGHKLLFHSAVLGTKEGVVLFPAEAGSGKSTLSAALAARGLRYYSDELAVLDLESFQVSPFALPLGIKSGSVDVLRRYYPALPELPLHLRVDEQWVRYLSPPAGCLSDTAGEEAPIRALVFPQYRPDEGTRLTLLEKTAALQRLALTGSSNREFTEKDVKAMIRVVERNPCFKLVFEDLEKGISLLKQEVFATRDGRR